MAKTTTLTLGDYFDKFVERQVAEGRYSSPEEVVREGLRLVERQVAKLDALHEAKLEALRAALIAGEESGEPEPFDFDEFIRSKNRQAAE